MSSEHGQGGVGVAVVVTGKFHPDGPRVQPVGHDVPVDRRDCLRRAVAVVVADECDAAAHPGGVRENLALDDGSEGLEQLLQLRLRVLLRQSGHVDI